MPDLHQPIMGQGSSKHYYDLLVAPEWSKGVESLSLVSDVSWPCCACSAQGSTAQHATDCIHPRMPVLQVCDLAEQLAADRCGKHAIKVYQKCCELRVSQAAHRCSARQIPASCTHMLTAENTPHRMIPLSCRG